MTTFFAWLTGRPPVRRRPAWWRWTGRLIAALGMAYFFLYGPGVRLWRSPPGFEKFTEGETTVFYQPGIRNEAVAVSAAALKAQRDVLEFWGRSADAGFDFAVDVYLCRNPRRYWHLVMNRAKGSASGNDLMIHASYPEVERIPYLRHELAHLFVVHELGWWRTRLHTPAWLDEGIATTIQGSQWNDRGGLARFVSRTHQLAPLSSTPNTLRWLGAVGAGGDVAGAQYSYARTFTEDLMDRFTRGAVLDFLTDATMTGDQSGAFARAFGHSLGEAEQQWVRDAMAGGVLPNDLELVDRGLPAALVTKLLVLLALATFFVLWSFRHAARAARAVARWTRNECHSSSAAGP